MVELASLILIGRQEPTTEDNRSIRMFMKERLDRAEWLWRYRWAERPADWDSWNVVALHGAFGAWSMIDFQTWKDLGRVPVPELVRVLRYVPAADMIDPIDVDPYDPPVLIGAHRLLAPPPKSVKGSRYKGTRSDQAYHFNQMLERHGLLADPRIHSKRGFRRALEEQRLAVSPDPDRWDLVEISDSAVNL